MLLVFLVVGGGDRDCRKGLGRSIPVFLRPEDIAKIFACSLESLAERLCKSSVNEQELVYCDA